MQTVEAKLWRNYQILVPPEVVESLGIRPGQNMRFTITDNEVEVSKV